MTTFLYWQRAEFFSEQHKTMAVALKFMMPSQYPYFYNNASLVVVE
jgi:hypothetical protein